VEFPESLESPESLELKEIDQQVAALWGKREPLPDKELPL
jgi:hypothetical protein